VYPNEVYDIRIITRTDDDDENLLKRVGSALIRREQYDETILSPGTQVIANYPDDPPRFWYKGIIEEVDEDGTTYFVRFNDGDFFDDSIVEVSLNKVRPYSWAR
jgi:hypothetical protein